MNSVKMITPDFLSTITQHLIIGFSPTKTVFSTATGFIYKYHDKYYLITNWHNVTGRHPQSGMPLTESHSGIPDSIETHFRLKDGNGRSRAETIQLYEDQEMTQPKWLVHPIKGSEIDVVALELKLPDDLELAGINDHDFENAIPPLVGDDCYVIGYPFESIRRFGLPIWKRASIATEPSVDEDHLPKLLIDTATRPGLSGSPVIYQRSGLHNVKDGTLNPDSLIGTIRGFLGVYSGRIGKGELHAQLGIVWKASVIEDILKGQVKDDIQFQKITGC